MNPELPESFLRSLDHVKGFDRIAFEKMYYSGDQVTALRFNPLKCPGTAFGPGGPAQSQTADAQGRNNIPLDPLSCSSFKINEKIPWSSYGYYLDQRPSFTLDPLLHAGLYYVQEPSSMFLEQILREAVDLNRPIRMLDLCAAPGGKSTLAQSLLSSYSLLVSNEVIRSRAGTLRENLIKWGASNIIISQNDPADFKQMEGYFDVVLVDAPCSGSGLFRKEPASVGEWSEEKVDHCSRRQMRILSDIWPSIRNDGILIYSTCSYSKKENEDVLDWIIQEFAPEALSLPLHAALEGEGWKIIETRGEELGGYGYRFYPDKLKGEGFFISCVRKKGGGTFFYPRIKKPLWEKLNKGEISFLQGWLREDSELSFIRMEGEQYAIPAHLLEDFQFLQSNLYLKKAGIRIGKMAGSELLPAHELALSTVIKDQLPAIELTVDQALRYLRKDDLQIMPAQKGWTLARYRSHNLGWVKVLGNRVNNYYPKDWKVLKK